MQTQMRLLHPIESFLGMHSFTVISYLLPDKEESAQFESSKRCRRRQGYGVPGNRELKDHLKLIRCPCSLAPTFVALP